MGKEEKGEAGGGKWYGLSAGSVFSFVTTAPAVRTFVSVGVALVLLAILHGFPKLFTLTTSQSILFALVGALLIVAGIVVSKTDSKDAKGAMDLLGFFLWAMFVFGIALSILTVLTYFRVIPMPARYSPRADLDEALIALGFASLCGFLPPLLAGRHFRNIPIQQREFLDELEKSRKNLETSREEMVGRINDATRTRLKGFPMVFDKALYMIRHAEQELIYVNFAMNFGSVHLLNDKVGRAYEDLDSSHKFKNDVNEFLSQLKGKVDSLPDVQVLTVFDNKLKESFLRPISKREGYDALKLEEKMDGVIAAAIHAKELIKYELGHPTDLSMKDSPRRVLVEANSLPIQLLITKIRDGDGPLRRGCLVFMVGTAMLSGLESGGEPGFYTEMDDMIYMFESVATALIASAQNKT